MVIQSHSKSFDGGIVRIYLFTSWVFPQARATTRIFDGDLMRGQLIDIGTEGNQCFEIFLWKLTKIQSWWMSNLYYTIWLQFQMMFSLSQEYPRQSSLFLDYLSSKLLQVVVLTCPNVTLYQLAAIFST